jgi:hypothetical protein
LDWLLQTDYNAKISDGPIDPDTMSKYNKISKQKIMAEAE